MFLFGQKVAFTNKGTHLYNYLQEEGILFGIIKKSDYKSNYCDDYYCCKVFFNQTYPNITLKVRFLKPYNEKNIANIGRYYKLI